MSDPVPDPEDVRKAKGRRNVALGLLLAAFVLLVFIVTIIRLGGGAH